MLSLGKISSCGRFSVDVKIILGIGGTILVLLSIVAAIGIFGYIGVSTTLIVFQILPFLVRKLIFSRTVKLYKYMFVGFGSWSGQYFHPNSHFAI